MLPRSLACLFALLTVFARHAAAAPVGTLRASHAEAALGCPSAEQLAATVNGNLGRQALLASAPQGSPGSIEVSVEFAQQGSVYSANVRTTGVHSGQRTLVDEGPNCAALGDAVVVLLVVLLDQADRPLSPSTSAAPTPRAPVARLQLAVGGGVTTGVVGASTSMLAGAGTLSFGDRVALKLGGAWLPSTTTRYAPGELRASLGFGRAALCWTPLRRESGWVLSACGAPVLGALSARGSSYDLANRSASHLFAAGAASLALEGPLLAPISWELEAGALKSVWRERFVVDHLGTAYESASFAFFVTLSLCARVL